MSEKWYKSDMGHLFGAGLLSLEYFFVLALALNLVVMLRREE